MSKKTPFSHKPHGSTEPPPPPPPPPLPDPTLIIADPVSRCASEACDAYWTNCGVFNSPENYSPTVPGVFPYGPDPATGLGCVGRYHIVAGTDEHSPFQYGKNFGAPIDGIDEIYAEFEIRYAAGTPFCGQKLFRLGDQSGGDPHVPGVNFNTIPTIFGFPQGLQIGVELNGADLYFQNFNLLTNWPPDTWARFGVWVKRGTLSLPDGAACVFANDIQIAGRRDLVMNIDNAAKWTFFWILANYSFGSGVCCPTPGQITACSNGDIYLRNIKIYSGKPAYVA